MKLLTVDRGMRVIDRQFANKAFGDVTIIRPFIQVNGRTIELIRNADCMYHFTSREHDMEICFGRAIQDEIYQIDEEHMIQCGCMKVCNHVCDAKKEEFSKLLDEHGQYLPEDTRKMIDSYLIKENDI